jgi:hypothetical protein
MQSVPEAPAMTDSCHVRETINMLYLAVCQIEATLSDSNNAVDTLTRSFVQLAEHTSLVNQQIQEIHRVEDLARLKDDMASTAAEMSANISASIKSFQFYDRICQRLDHVARGLERVSRVMEDKQRINNPEAWHQIQEAIRGSYTMEAERIMFEFVIRGGSVQEALQIYRHHFDRQDTVAKGDDEILLF